MNCNPNEITVDGIRLRHAAAYGVDAFRGLLGQEVDYLLKILEGEAAANTKLAEEIANLAMERDTATAARDGARGRVAELQKLNDKAAESMLGAVERIEKDRKDVVQLNAQRNEAYGDLASAWNDNAHLRRNLEKVAAHCASLKAEIERK